MQLKKFNNLFDLLTFFNSEQVCRDYLEASRWGGNLTCPYKECQHTHIFKYTDGKRYKCAKCQRQYSVRVGTIFEDSKIPLAKWFAAIYLITSHKKGISSLQLHRDLSVTQKTAWFMLHRVRKSLGIDLSEDKLTGVVEADETQIGGKDRNKHKSKRGKNDKLHVAGVMQRGGELRLRIVPDRSGQSLQQFLIENVKFGTNLNTDDWLGYSRLGGIYKHKYVNHNADEYVRGEVHTQNIEGYWSQLKRSIYGIYHSVSAKHLQFYLDESAFRFNTRKCAENERFDLMLRKAHTHITYNELINKHDTSSNTKADNRYMEGQQGIISF